MATQQTPRSGVVHAPHGKGVSQGATTHKDYQKIPCELTDIKAFCEHEAAPPKPQEAAPKPPSGPAAPPAKPAVPAAKPAAPPPATKPGGPRYAREEETKHEVPPPHPAGPPHPATAHPPAAAKPSAQHPKPAPVAVKPLVLEVIPHAAGAEAPSSSTGTSLFGMGELSFSQGAAGAGDKVTLKAIMSSHCSQHPQWKIKETGPGAASPPVILQGMQVTHLFLPPRIPKQFWLEKVEPRRYSVECEVHGSAPNAHKSLEVHVYPFVESKLTLKSASTKTPKNGWEKALATVRDVVESALKEMVTLVPGLAKAELKILEGELTLSNSWKENEEEEPNLAHWQAELEAKLTILSVEGNIDLTDFSFIKGAVDKFERFFTAVTGLGAEAGIYLIPSSEIKLGGTGIWEGGKAPQAKGLDITGTLGLELKAELKATYKRDGELADMSGGGKTELSIKGTPQLESGPHLWIDTELEWNPLHIKLEAKLRAPSNGIKPSSAGGKLSAEQVAGDDKGGKKVGPSYEKDIFPSIKRALGRVTLLSGNSSEAQPAQTPVAH